MIQMENLTTEKVNDELTEEELKRVKVLVSYVAYLFMKALIKVRCDKYGNCNRGSNESDDESQGMHEGVSLVPGK